MSYRYCVELLDGSVAALDCDDQLGRRDLTIPHADGTKSVWILDHHNTDVATDRFILARFSALGGIRLALSELLSGLAATR